VSFFWQKIKKVGFAAFDDEDSVVAFGTHAFCED
jgi:hypothetical protein